MPSKKPKTKTNQTSVQQRRTEKRADLTHLPPDPESRSRPLLFGLTPPRGLLLRPQRKTKKKINMSISQPLSLSRPARATMISPILIPRVSTLNKLSLLRCVPFRGYVPNKEREKNVLKRTNNS